MSAGTDRPMVYKRWLGCWAWSMLAEKLQLRLQNLFSHCGGASWSTREFR